MPLEALLERYGGASAVGPTANKAIQALKKRDKFTSPALRPKPVSASANETEAPSIKLDDSLVNGHGGNNESGSATTESCNNSIGTESTDGVAEPSFTTVTTSEEEAISGSVVDRTSDMSDGEKVSNISNGQTVPKSDENATEKHGDADSINGATVPHALITVGDGGVLSNSIPVLRDNSESLTDVSKEDGDVVATTQNTDEVDTTKPKVARTTPTKREKKEMKIKIAETLEQLAELEENLDSVEENLVRIKANIARVANSAACVDATEASKDPEVVDREDVTDLETMLAEAEKKKEVLTRQIKEVQEKMEKLRDGAGEPRGETKRKTVMFAGAEVDVEESDESETGGEDEEGGMMNLMRKDNGEMWEDDEEDMERYGDFI